MTGSSRARRRPTTACAAAAAAALALLASGSCASGAGGEAGGPQTSVAPPSSVAPRSSVAPPGSSYVALGSSFAAGPGLEPVADADCFRSEDNYANHVAAALELNLTDVSCTGATTDNTPVQIESVTEDTTLVTITLGGNDIGYATSLDEYACLDIGLCETISVDQAAIDDGLATIADELVTTLDLIKDRAPEALVLLVTYPRIVPPAGETCADMPLTAEHADFARTVGEGLDTAFRDAAARSGAQLVDVYSASSERGVCEPDDPWVGGLPPGTAPSGTFPFHPTAAGMQAVAELIVRALA